MMSDSPSQELIPDKHFLIENMSCLVIAYILLVTPHYIVRIAKKEIFRKVHHTQESLVSIHQQIENTTKKIKESDDFSSLKHGNEGTCKEISKKKPVFISRICNVALYSRILQRNYLAL